MTGKRYIKTTDHTEASKSHNVAHKIDKQENQSTESTTLSPLTQESYLYNDQVQEAQRLNMVKRLGMVGGNLNLQRMVKGNGKNIVNNNLNKSQTPVIQRAGPLALLAGLGTALSTEGAAAAASVAGAVIAAGAMAQSVGAAIMPGNTGVQSYQLESGWMSRVDVKTQIMIQYRLVNKYIEI
jgi:hypothetical protein